MARPVPLVLAMLTLLAVLSGCAQAPSDEGKHPRDHPGTTFSDSFDGQGLDGWETAGGSWTSVAGDSRMAQGAGAAQPGLSSLLAPAGTFEDLELEVDLQMLAGEHPQGAGIVLHWVDDENYQIVRYSVSEVGWHLFVVNEGNRDKRPEATVNQTASAPQFGDWVHLRVRSQAGRVQAWHDDTLVLEAHLADEDSHRGQVGLFVRGDTTARFDDFAVRAL